MFKYLHRKIYGKRDDRIKSLKERVLSLSLCVEKQDRKILDLMDLRHELSVALDKAPFGRMEVAVIVSDPSPIAVSATCPTDTHTVPSERVTLERCVGAKIIPVRGRAYLNEASEDLKYMVANYCGEYVAEKLKEELRG